MACDTNTITVFTHGIYGTSNKYYWIQKHGVTVVPCSKINGDIMVHF